MASTVMPFSRLTAVAGVLAGPGQATRMTQAAVPASIATQAARCASSASRAISRAPPARHASRARPLGACPVSANSASAHSRAGRHQPEHGAHQPARHGSNST